MFFRLQNQIQRSVFDLACRQIWIAPPIELRRTELAIVTMLSHADVVMYAVALRSLYARLNAGDVIVLDDGSLTRADTSFLARQFPGITIELIKGIRTGSCPLGCCWERLVRVLALTASMYVIQMDSDTVVQGEVEEVLMCYRENRPFTLGTEDGRAIVSVEENYRMIRDSHSSHVQVLAEKQLPNLSSGLGRKYVRGSAGFAGFARNGFTPERLQRFSSEMDLLVGRTWREWGSEQVASNYVVANSPGATVLPYPKYACFRRGLTATDCHFLHFVGTHRFASGVYRKVARKQVRHLCRNADGWPGDLSDRRQDKG